MYEMLLWTSLNNVTRYVSGLSTLLNGVISFQEATPFNNFIFFIYCFPYCLSFDYKEVQNNNIC